MTAFRKHAKADDALKLFKLLRLPNMRWRQQRRNGKGVVGRGGLIYS
jgi:hypothetical protein